MRDHLLSLLKIALLLCLLVLLFRCEHPTPVHANVALQDSCALACVCEGYTVEKLEYDEENEIDSECRQRWQELRFYYSRSDTQREDFLRERQKSCDECRAGTPTPLPQTPGYSATCDVSWSRAAPLIFNIHVQDAQGNKLQGYPDDYIIVEIFWDPQRVPSNQFDGLLAIRPQRPKDRVAFADAQGFQTQSANPIVIETMTDQNGVARLFVRSDFWQYSPGVSPEAPISWSLNLTRKYRALTTSGDTFVEESLGSCKLTIDSIAYVWGVKGLVRAENSQLGRADRYVSEGDLLTRGDVLTAFADSDGSKSYAMLTYLDGTRFGMRGNCPQESPSCSSLRISEMTWGYVFWKMTGVAADQAGDQLTEYLITTVSKRLAPAANLYFLMDDAYDLGKFAFSQEWSDTCAKLGSTPEDQASILNDYYRDSNIDTRPRLTCASLNVRSLINITVQGDQLNIQTFEGEPLIVSDSGELSLPSGQQMSMGYGGADIQTSSFDPDTSTLDWDQALLQTETNEPDAALSPRFSMPQLSLLWGIIPAILCFGASLVVLAIGFLAKNKKLSIVGLILIGIVVCLSMLGAGLYGISFWMEPTSTTSDDTSPAIANTEPPLDPQPNNPEGEALLPAPEAFTEADPETPFTQEVSPQPSIYDFAACLEPCLSDLSNNRATFPERTQEIHFRLRYDWFAPGSDYVRVWKNQGQEWTRYQCRWDGPESGVFETILREPAGLRSGDWTMEIYIGGSLITQTSLTVQGSYEYWDPVGTVNRCK